MVNVNSDKEWIRRRQMRLMQVRKQSSDIAKMLRERVVDEETQRKIAEEQEMELNLKLWKFRRLNDLEKMYRNAIKDFGTGHNLSSKEPVTEKLELEKEYLSRAKKRGESALQQELKIKEEADKRKTIPIERKLITRKIEDLRSMLVRSIAAKKSSVLPRHICVEKVFDPKLFECRDEIEGPDIQELSEHERKIGTEKQLHPVKLPLENQFLRKKVSGKKENRRKKMSGKNQDEPDVKCEEQKKCGTVREGTSKLNSLKSEKLWIDLGVVEVLTENEEIGDKEEEQIELKIEKDRREDKRLNAKEKTGKKSKNTQPKKESVECCGYSFSHNCNLKENTGLVQKMDNQSEPNAVELAVREEEKLLSRADEENNRRMVAKERGSRAILKEKVNRSLTELLTKLEKLSTKEKLIKTYCHLPPSHIFYSDERRQEKLSKKQQKMDSEFERLYYNVKGVNPERDPRKELNVDACARGFEPDKENGNVGTKLNLNGLGSDLKGNGRASSCRRGKEKEQSDRDRGPVERITIKKTPSSLRYKRTKVIKGGKKTISDIDKILEKSRKLREESGRGAGLPSRECKSDNDFSERKSDAKEEDNSECREMSLGSLASGSIELELNKFDSSSPSEGERVSDILNGLKKSLEPKPTDPSKAILEDLGMGDLGINFPRIRNDITAWPVHGIDRTRDFDNGFGNATSYMSIPEEIHPDKFRDLMNILDDLRGREENSRMTDEQLEKLEDLLCSVMGELELSYASSCKDDSWSSQESSDLSNYISKLLDMSREKVSKLLNSSSESESSPKQHDSSECGKSQTRLSNEGKCPGTIAESSQSPQQAKAKDLDVIITKWKCVLEQVLENSPTSDRSNQFEGDKTNVKYAKKAPERQGKAEVSSRPKSKVRSGEFSHQTRNSCSEKEISAGSSRSKCEEPRDRSSECKASPTSETKGHKSRDPSVKSNRKAHGGPMPGSGSNVFICDERTCPYLQPGACHGGADYPNVMNHLLNKRIISSPFQWTKKGNACDRSSYITPDDPVNKTYDVSKCKFGCPSPCPGHTEVLKRRRFFDQPPGSQESSLESDSPSIPHAFWARMNYIDRAQGVFSPLPAKAKYMMLKGQEQEEKPKYVPPDFQNDGNRERFDWNRAPDWYEYASRHMWNLHRPFMIPSKRKYTGERFYPEGGRIWKRELDSSYESSSDRTNPFETTWSDIGSDPEDENPHFMTTDWMQLDTKKKLLKREKKKQENFECHGHEADCDSECKKDVLTLTLKRLKKDWLESRKPSPTSLKAATCCYHACAAHCHKRKDESDEWDDYSSSDFDSSLDDSCCNACPAHCQTNVSSDACEASDDGTPKSPTYREKMEAYLKSFERPRTLVEEEPSSPEQEECYDFTKNIFYHMMNAD